MAKFNAATVVEALEFTLEPFVNLSGTIREPNDQQIATYLAGVKTMTADIRAELPDIPENASQADMFDAMESLDPEVFMKMSAKLADLTAALCSDKPNAEQLLAVPPRIRNVFYGWLQEQVMDPEVVNSDGKAALNGQR